ncbi:hypothetical protein EIP86_011005 [Pleurotus ostreatoroseus]|nr:hypothetical protein EIP86_011005 [Pleurotus ostreatoroseus]
MFSLIPSEILGKIALDLLSDLRFVCAFAGVCCCTVASARHELFRDCYTYVGGDELSIANFIHDITENPDIAQSVRTLTLHSIYGVEPHGSRTSLQEIGELLGYLTTLRSLHLIHFDWIAYHGLYPALPLHPTVNTLVLGSIMCTSANASPFDLLRFVTAWENFTVEDLEPHRLSMAIHGGPMSRTWLSYGAHTQPRGPWASITLRKRSQTWSNFP